MKLALHSSPWGIKIEGVLAAAATLGIAGVESYVLPQWHCKPGAFAELLGGSGVTLAAIEFGADWTAGERLDVHLKGAREAAVFLSALGVRTFVVGGGKRTDDGGETRRRLAGLLDDLGGEFAAMGVALCYPPRIGGVVEHRDQIELLLAETSPERVRLCLDTASLAAAGIDPLELATSHGDRIGHIHLSDLDGETLRPVVPGKGCLDLKGIVDAAKKSGYGGWVTLKLPEGADASAGYAEAVSLAREWGVE